jgi:hypothetical protein
LVSEVPLPVSLAVSVASVPVSEPVPVVVTPVVVSPEPSSPQPTNKEVLSRQDAIVYKEVLIDFFHSTDPS